jgi:hypothetical protein
MALLRYCLVALTSALCLCLVSWLGASLLYRGLGLSQRLETGSLASFAYFGRSEVAPVAYNRTPLIREAPQVIIIGGSNVVKLSAAEMSAHLGGMAVHNMAFSGSFIKDMGQAIDLVYEVVPRQAWSRITFAVGLWYGVFSSAEKASQIDQELLRYRLYERTHDGKVALRMPSSLLEPASIALRPVLLSAHAWDDVTTISSLVLAVLLNGTADAQDHPVTGNEALLWCLRRTFMTALANEAALAELQRFARLVSARGSRLVILDTPIPPWHAKAAPAFAYYQQRRTALFEELQRLPGVFYYDMQAFAADDDFIDCIHPDPRVARVWAGRLAEELRPIWRPASADPQSSVSKRASPP